jgi:hypothetical protein
MDIQIYDKLKKIEQEVLEMKLTLLKSGMLKKDKRPVSLEGIWEGIDITEGDIKSKEGCSLKCLSLKRK